MNLVAICFAISVTLSNDFPAYITQWRSQIESASRLHCVDANLIAAVIIMETGDGNASVIAPLDGGIGLMQIMSSDNPVRPDLSVKWRPRTAELLDPMFNIDYGTGILADVLRQEDGDLLQSLGRYNCGEKNLYLSRMTLEHHCGQRGGYNYAWSVYKLLKKYNALGSLACDEHQYLYITPQGETVFADCHYEWTERDKKAIWSKSFSLAIITQ